MVDSETRRDETRWDEGLERARHRHGEDEWVEDEKWNELPRNWINRINMNIAIGIGNRSRNEKWWKMKN